MKFEGDRYKLNYSSSDEISGATVTPPNDTDISGATTTPTEDNKQDTDKPATNSPKEDDSNNKPSDGKPNKTSDAASMVGIFTMFAGLIGTIGFKKKRK